VTEGIHDRFVAALTERLKALSVDDALGRHAYRPRGRPEPARPGSESYIEIGKQEGAKLHWGGERSQPRAPASTSRPALFTEVRQRHAHQPRGDLRPRRGVIR
jgi:alpha-ketoglutaric semialdehyde dehydrogenase